MVRRHWLTINITALLFALAQAVLQRSGFGTGLEYQLSDLWFHLRGPVSAPTEVVILSQDHESYSRLNLSPIKPWPRSHIVDLLRRLAVYRPKKVVIDIIFSGESEDLQADSDLAEALSQIHAVIGSDFISIGTGAEVKSEDMQPDPVYAASARELARISLPLDQDVIRRFRDRDGHSLQGLRTLAEAAASANEPTDPDFLINYYGPPGTIRTYSIYQLLQGAVPAEMLRDKLVFVGYGLATGIAGRPRDSFLTPFRGGPSFGVEIHATAAANLLHNSFIKRADPGRERLMICVLVFILSLSVLSLHPQWGAVLLGGVTAAWAIISYQSFTAGFFIPGLTAALVVMPFVLLASSVYYYLIVYRSRQQLREALGRYVSPEIAARIVNDAAQDFYRTENRLEVTMLFTDIKGFTSWAECNGHNQVLATLNRYFSEIAAIVLDSQGTVMKYAGDGMFALWGAPLAVDNPSKRALQAALDIRSRVRDLAEKGILPFFETRAGIHRAEVSVGNLGERRRFDYTAVGDGVNVTSRLEDLNKFFGTGILLSEEVLGNLDESFSCIKMGSVRLRGKSGKVTVYTLLEETARMDCLELWLKGVEDFEQSRFDEARRVFRLVSENSGPFAVAARQYLKALDHRPDVITPELSQTMGAESGGLIFVPPA